MKKLLASLVLLVMAFGYAACSPKPPPPPPVSNVRQSEDYYTVYSGEITGLNPLITSTTAEFSVLANCIDGLVEHNNLGIIQPALAESWTTSPDGLVWTFKIRPGVKWYTFDGKEYGEVVAQDWVDAHKYGFNPEVGSANANIAYEAVKNGQAYYDGEVGWDQVGIKALDKYTLEYTLDHPIPYFLSMLCYMSFVPMNGQFITECGEDFGTDHTKILYCGAYIISEWEHQNFRTMVKNENYWDADNVHIKKLNYKFNKEAGTLAPDLFLKGEISSTGIPSTVLNDWLNDPTRKDMVTPNLPSEYSYFYAFNFDPHFPAEYEPENWKVVVNNKNFRKSLFHALDREAAMLTSQPYDPRARINNTITPKNFCSYGGKDFTDYGPLVKFTETESFNPEEAKRYRDLAKVELAGKATFPVKVYMPYNASGSEWTNRCVIVEQQLEGLLGADYIDIIPVGFPATNFLRDTRRAGNYAFQECNWGPDYADPETMSDPFYPPAEMNYNWPEKAEGYTDPNGLSHYQNLVEAAKAEVVDIAKRFELFAVAEAWIIEEAIVIPYGLGGGGYSATKVEPFTSPFAKFGSDSYKWKGQVIMEKPMNMEQYAEARQKWEAAREAALAAQK